MRKWGWKSHLIIVLALAAGSGVMWTVRAWQLERFRNTYPGGCSLYDDECRKHMVGKEIEVELRSSPDMHCVDGLGRFENIRVKALPANLPTPKWKLVPEDKTTWELEIRAQSASRPHVGILAFTFPPEWAGKTATIKVEYDLTYPEETTVLPQSVPRTYANTTASGTAEITIRPHGERDLRAMDRFRTIDNVTTYAGILLLVACGGYVLVLFLRFVGGVSTWGQ